jgi:hypothetical protein
VNLLAATGDENISELSGLRYPSVFRAQSSVRQVSSRASLSGHSALVFLFSIGLASAPVSPRRAYGFLDLALFPSGRLRLAASDPAIDIEPARLARLTHAFERGSGEGLVQLGGAELEGELPPAHGWFREFGRLFFTALRRRR